MRVYFEESFGPLVSVVIAENSEDALRIANDTEYGLSSAIYSRDINKAMKIAERLETGMCHINSSTVHDEPQMPFGGVKDSGWDDSAAQPFWKSSPNCAGSPLRDPQSHTRSEVCGSFEKRFRTNDPRSIHPRLYRQILLLHGEMNLVIARGDVGFIRDIAQAVLIAEFFINRRVNLIDGLFFGDFKNRPPVSLDICSRIFFPSGRDSCGYRRCPPPPIPPPPMCEPPPLPYSSLSANRME